jgi:hypothetical protein
MLRLRAATADGSSTASLYVRGVRRANVIVRVPKPGLSGFGPRAGLGPRIWPEWSRGPMRFTSAVTSGRRRLFPVEKR